MKNVRFMRSTVIIGLFVAVMIFFYAMQSIMYFGNVYANSDLIFVDVTYVDSKVKTLESKISSVDSKVKSLDEKIIGDVDALNKRILEFFALVLDISKKVDDQKLEIESLKEELKNTTERLEKTPKGTFVVVEAKKNDKIIVGGGVEIVLRGGSAMAISSSSGGLANLFAGVDLFTGDLIPLNELLLASRDDGRGLEVLSDTAWILIKGDYTIN